VCECELDSASSEYVSELGSLEYCGECSIKVGEFFEQQSEYQLLKKGHVL
jgi:hypothetical protein